MASDLTPEELARLRSIDRVPGPMFYYINHRELWDSLPALLDMAERCADYDRRLSEVMPKDFKDWHQNAKAEWPEVAASTITNLRKREEWAMEQLARVQGERDCLNEQCDFYKADLDAIRAMVPNVEGVFTQDLVREHVAKIHRVLVAAREAAANTADDIDERLRYVEVRPHRDEWRELVDALRALDDKEQRT